MSQLQGLQLIILFMLLLLSAFFSASETALFSTKRLKIRHLAEEGNRQAILTNRLLEQAGKSIATILIGNNLVNIGATALATVLAISFFGSSGAGIATLVMTILVLVFGEITPKTLAARHAEKTALRFSPYIYALGKVLAPFIYIFNSVTGFLVRIIDGPEEEEHFVTEEDLRILVNVGEKEGLLDQVEREMIDSIFEFDDTQVREIMVPRLDIDAVEVGETLENTIKLVLQAGRSRIPVYQASIDEIIGVIYAKDLLKFFGEPERKGLKLAEIMRQPYYVPESKKVRDLFTELSKEKVHMAIVLDEYGSTAGLVTIEDAIEEIMGDIQDEYDQEEKLIELLADGVYLVDGRTPIDEINQMIGLNLPDDEFETITGYVFHHWGRLPEEGQIIKINNLEIKIDQISGGRIGKLILRKI
ncbi:MAG TPA: HlyC/CorC family transporter [Clostridia bacterium]|nr:HlyC/CorC family transporter [Clostridia bacterium]